MNASDFNDKYRAIKFPNKRDFTKYYFYSKGEVVVAGSTFNDIPQEYSVKEKVVDEVAYKAANDAARQKMAEVEQEFAQWLYNDLLIQDNPKKEKLYAIAYEKGHSGGFAEVYNEALDLVGLIE